MKYDYDSQIDAILKELREIKEELCKIKGHDFGNWEKTDLALEGIPMPIGPIIRWKRVCNRCGFAELVKQNPNEFKEKKHKGCQKIKMIKKLTKNNK